jgi:hypothetical protein
MADYNAVLYLGISLGKMYLLEDVKILSLNGGRMVKPKLHERPPPNLLYVCVGITPLNEERRPPNYIPRVFSSPTQYGSIYTDSR